MSPSLLLARAGGAAIQVALQHMASRYRIDRYPSGSAAPSELRGETLIPRSYRVRRAGGELLDEGLDRLELLIRTSGERTRQADDYGVGSLALRRRQHSGDDRVRILLCLLYTSPSPRDRTRSRMPSSA